MQTHMRHLYIQSSNLYFIEVYNIMHTSYTRNICRAFSFNQTAMFTSNNISIIIYLHKYMAYIYTFFIIMSMLVLLLLLRSVSSVTFFFVMLCFGCLIRMRMEEVVETELKQYMHTMCCSYYCLCEIQKCIFAIRTFVGEWFLCTCYKLGSEYFRYLKNFYKCTNVRTQRSH